MNRLAIFSDPDAVAARVLLPALLTAVSRRPDMTCVALLANEPGQGGRHAALRWRLDRGRRRLQAALGSGRWERSLDVPPLDLRRLAAAHGVPVMPLPGGDPNHPDVPEFLARDARANLAMNIHLRTPFRGELLGCFDMAVNYHNGSLPRFRGLRASNWSLYLGADSSGFSFHRMDAGLDTGNVLQAGEVPVEAGDTPAELELRKAEAARDRLPELLDALLARQAGRPQRAVGCSHTRQAHDLVTRVENPSALSHDEWRRRLRAFLRVHTRIEGRWWPVTGIAPGGPAGRLAFRSADGAWLRVTGIDFWPAGWISRVRIGSGDVGH